MRLVAPHSPCTGGQRLPPQSPGLTTLGRLVGAVGAVAVVVAHEVLGDALAVLAHELTVVAGAVVHWTEVSTAP